MKAHSPSSAIFSESVPEGDKEVRRACDVAGCEEEGRHRAPKGRDYANGTHWFCLRHVKEFNRNWNYFRGMNPAQMRAAFRSSIIWDRPTWSVNRPAAHETLRDGRRWVDPLNMFTREFREAERTAPTVSGQPRRCEQALKILDLEPTATAAQIRRRALALIKRLHPDTNKGRTVDSNRLLAVIWAWRRLRSVGVSPGS